MNGRGRSEADMVNLPNHAKDSSYNRKFCRPGQVKPPARPLSFTQCKLDIQEVTESLAPISYFWTCYLFECNAEDRMEATNAIPITEITHSSPTFLMFYLFAIYCKLHTRLSLYAHYLSSSSSPNQECTANVMHQLSALCAFLLLIMKNQSSKNQQKTR